MVKYLDPTNYSGGKEQKIDIDWVVTTIILPAIATSKVGNRAEEYIEAIETMYDFLSSRAHQNKKIKEKIEKLEKDLEKSLKDKGPKHALNIRKNWAQELFRILITLIDRTSEDKEYEA